MTDPGQAIIWATLTVALKKFVILNQIQEASSHLSIAYRPWASRVFSLPPTCVLTSVSLIQNINLAISHHKAFVGMDNVEESEEDIHGDNFEGVKDDHADFHVARAVEARSCLLSIGFVGVF